jgi:hypothetical protein
MHKFNSAYPLCTLAVAIAVALPSTCLAVEDKSLEVIYQQIQQLQETVVQQQKEIETLKSSMAIEEGMQIRGRGLQNVQEDTEKSVSTAEQKPQPEQAAETPVEVGKAQQDTTVKRRPSEDAIVAQEHAPLFDRKFTVEAGANYSYYDRRQLTLSGFLALDAIFLGTIDIDQVKSNVMTSNLTARYGLSDRWSLEIDVPFVYRKSNYISAGAGGASSSFSEVSVNASGIGDVSGAAFYHITQESSKWPDIVANVRIKSDSGRSPFGIKLVQPDPNNNNLSVPDTLPTGNGIWSATVGLSALRTYDPVVLFGSIGYTYSRPTAFDDISAVQNQIQPAKILLGGSYQFSAGMALALNDRTSMSLAYSTAFSSATKTQLAGQAAQTVAGSTSHSSVLSVGMGYVLSDNYTVNGVLNIGLTPDAPNYVFGARISRSF